MTSNQIVNKLSLPNKNHKRYYLTFELKNWTEEEEYCKVRATMFKYDEDWNCIEFIRIKGSAIMFHEKYLEI